MEKNKQLGLVCPNPQAHLLADRALDLDSGPSDLDGNQEKTVSLRDDNLDDIVQNIVGINLNDDVIKVDKSGMEIVTEQADSDENDIDSGSEKIHSDFSLDQLQAMLTNNPGEYKKCTLHVKTWCSANAVVHDPDADLEVICINTKFNLGRSFNLDEVVVHIEEKVHENDPENNEERLIAYGKVVGVLSRYRDPAEIKFICVPDAYNPSLMYPIDRKITKFVIQGQGGMSHNDFKIPICQLQRDKNGKDTVVRKHYTKYDRFSMTLENTKHFVVRFIKWPRRSYYPVGYVSEEIKPKDFEHYYSVLHDVPSTFHEKSAASKNAEDLANQSVDGSRRDLKNSFVFTIDAEGSTDLDDAMSLDKCTEHDKCWKIGIHVTDVASVVPADSDVDLEARKRAVSFYSGDVNRDKERKTIHMLPKSLSSKKCSLLADGESRPTISVFFHSTKLPILISSDKEDSKKVSNLPTPELTYVTSRKQMTYREAEICLRRVRQDGTQDITECNEDNLGDQLYIIWKTMLRLRFQRIDWSSFYMTPDFNELDKFCDEASAHLLIEEAMITYNSCCSYFLNEKNCDFLLQTQSPPTSERTLEWKEENIESIVLSLHQQGCLKYMHGQDVISQMENEPQELTIPIFPHVWMKIQRALESNDLDTALILFSCDTMQPALSPGHSGYLSIQNKAALQPRSEVCRSATSGSVTHFSLRLPLYSWFSSPIRRYTDIQSQRLILEKISTLKKSKDSKVIEKSQPKPLDLTDLSKKLMRRGDDANHYEKDSRNCSYALSLLHDQNYEAASIKEISDNGVFLEFVDLRNLSRTSCQLRYSDLRLVPQNKKDAAQTKADVGLLWKIKYFEVEETEQSTDDTCFTNFTSTVVSSTEWSTLLRSVKSLVFDDSSEKPINKHSENLLKTNLKNVIKSQNVQHACNRTSTQRIGPCNNDECRYKNVCYDFLDERSKLGIYHYRVITIPLALGTPLLVQLHCGVQRGICAPSVQLLALSQDLDICIAHNSSPVETFAADVQPILTAENCHKADKQKLHFKSIEEYTNHWLSLIRMDGVHNAVKDNSNSTILQNVPVTFDDTGSQLCGSFTLAKKFCQERVIRFYADDFVCIRVKCFNSDAKGDKSQLNWHKLSFTWVVHAVIQGTSGGVNDDVFKFSACMSLDGDTKIPTAVKHRGKNLRAVVEVIQLGSAHRGFANILRILAASEDNESEVALDNKDIILALCLDRPVEVRPPPSSIDKVIRSVGESVVPGMKYLLNEGQIKEIRKALSSRISMIQGPPGSMKKTDVFAIFENGDRYHKAFREAPAQLLHHRTGKSFVGAHLAYYFVQCNKKNPDGPGKILYCGPSNKSVDVVAEYLLETNIKVLRVYGNTFEEEEYPNPLRPKLDSNGIFNKNKKPSNKIKAITLHRVIRKAPQAVKIRQRDVIFGLSRSDITFDDYTNHKNAVTAAKFSELQGHDVIICTCATAATLRDSLKDLGFAQCIIDECGMCNEPETLAPIIASEAEQVVLIGDHMQLQPIIHCRRAKEFGLDVSMFKRRKDEASMLTIQYRMDPGICDFPSNQFYDGDLTTDQSVTDREKQRLFRFCYPPDSNNTAVFCHVAGTEAVNSENSFYNEQEANVVIKVLHYLHRNKVPLSKIKVLTPHRAQISTIKLLKEQSQLKDVHVGTVVQSQGSESDFVILSTVRSRPSSAIEDEPNLQWRRDFISFVADPHQTNLAITRARSGLCIVGNQFLLEKDTETWKPLLENYRRRKSVVNCDDRNAPWNILE